MSENKGWIVTTSSERPLSDITRDLTEAGYSIGQVLEEIGSITGAAGEEAIKKVRSITGVVDVSPDAPVDIGPPDSPDTW